MKYQIYTRVSERGSDWEGETSCAAQADEVRRFMSARHPGAKEIGPPLVDEFRTGTNLERPALQEMLRACKSGAPIKWDALVVLDVDRLARSMEGFCDVLRVLRDAGRGFISTRQDFDMCTPHGRLFMQMLVLMAEFFAGQGAVKTRDKMLWIARQGLWPAGRTPMGYCRAGKKDNRLVPDPDSAARVAAIFCDAAKGLHIIELCRAHRLPRNTVIKVLRNPIVIGRLKYGSVDVPGKHDPIVDQQTWDKVQELHRLRPMAKGIERPTRQQHRYLLTGLVRCSCGNAMSPATCRGRHGGKYPYYRCTSVSCDRKGYVRADQLEHEVRRQLEEVRFDRETINEVAAILADRVRKANLDSEGDIRQITENLREARVRRQRLLDAIATGKISGAALGDVNSILGETITAIQKWESEIEQSKRERPIWDADRVRQALDLLMGSAKKIEGDPLMLAAWMRSHVRSITPREDGSWALQFELPQGSTSTYNWHPEGALVELVFTLKKRVS